MPTPAGHIDGSPEALLEAQVSRYRRRDIAAGVYVGGRQELIDAIDHRRVSDLSARHPAKRLPGQGALHDAFEAMKVRRLRRFVR